MSKVIEMTANDILKKHGVTLDEHTWVEKGWLNIEMGYEVDWDSIQNIDAILSAADPKQKIYVDYTAMGDDVPNTLSFKISALDKVAEILEQNGESLQEVLWMAGPGTYSEEGEAAFFDEQGYDDDDEDDK